MKNPRSHVHCSWDKILISGPEFPYPVFYWSRNASICGHLIFPQGLIPARHILLIQALHSLNGTPGEIWTHTILILSQTPHASWATGAYRWVCATTLALLGCPPASYSHSVWDATKVSPLLLSKILDFYQAPRSLPDYYCLTPPIALAAVFSTAEIYIGWGKSTRWLPRWGLTPHGITQRILSS